jgi:hypothetical protein
MTPKRRAHGKLHRTAKVLSYIWRLGGRLGLCRRPGASLGSVRARSSGFKQLADLTIAIGLMNAYNRISIGFRAAPMALAA